MGDNQLLLDALFCVLDTDSFVSLYLWSRQSSGKTHLLHAVCNEYAEQGKLVSYIPLEQHALLIPEILSGLEKYDLICLDNIECIAGIEDWEEAIFDLFNKLTETQSGKLFITANASPKQVSLKLADLVSRLEWGQIYQLKELNDKDKIKALQLRAALKGFDLPTDVGFFLLKRVDRNMRTLCCLLEKLDIVTITEQRKLTIPFVKNIFNL